MSLLLCLPTKNIEGSKHTLNISQKKAKNDTVTNEEMEIEGVCVFLLAFLLFQKNE